MTDEHTGIDLQDRRQAGTDYRQTSVTDTEDEDRKYREHEIGNQI